MGTKKKSRLADDLADSLLDNEPTRDGPVRESKAGGIEGGTVQTQDVVLETAHVGGERTREQIASDSPHDFYQEFSSQFPKEESNVFQLDNEPTRPIENAIEKEPSLKPKPVPQRTPIPVAPTPKAQTGNLERLHHLQIAQERILELEGELDRLRLENDELQASTESLKTRLEENQRKLSSTERDKEDLEDVWVEEKKLSMEANISRDKELERLRQKNEELEKRLVGDLKRVRVRERELENRLEIIKSEHAAVIRSKNEMILNVKRQTDLVAQELEAVKQKGKSVQDQFAEHQDRGRRAVKALRLAMALLNGEETEKQEKVKKAE